MKSLFVFGKNGAFAEELKQENIAKSKTVKDMNGRQLYFTKEKTEITKEKTISTLYKVPLSPGDADFIWAVVEELERQEFKIFIFEGKKIEIARLLVTAPLTDKERLELFNNLVAIPDSEVAELKKGIEEDLRQI